MAKAKTKTKYTVHSALTGAVVCGPYEAIEDAEREKSRLNREAQTGVRAKPAYSGEPKHERNINYRQRWSCKRCGRELRKDRKGIVACPVCKTTLAIDGVLNEAAFEAGEQIPKPIDHREQAMIYEVRSSEGLVL